MFLFLFPGGSWKNHSRAELPPSREKGRKKKRVVLTYPLWEKKSARSGRLQNLKQNAVSYANN